MRKKRKKNKEQIAALEAKVNELQCMFNLFLESSSQTENPENHDKILKKYIREITKLKNKIDELSK